MRPHRLAAAVAGFAALVLAPFAHATVPDGQASLLIKVDKSLQQMTVIADGEQLYTWPVSTGRDGYNTPSGDFTPFRMDRHHFSEEWDDAPMPYSIFFTKQGHAIHGTYEQRHLGRAVSHGCVRLSVKHAAILWDLVKQYGKMNTEVVLTGKIPPRAPKVAHMRTDDDVTGSVARRVARDDERARYEARERRYEARERYYDDPLPRYARRYVRPPRYYDRYDGPPPMVPFFLMMRPPGY